MDHVLNVVHMKPLMELNVKCQYVVRMKFHLKMDLVFRFHLLKLLMQRVLKVRKAKLFRHLTKKIQKVDLTKLFLVNLRRYKRKIYQIQISNQESLSHHGLKTMNQMPMDQAEEETLIFIIQKFPLKIAEEVLVHGVQNMIFHLLHL